jgi:hypothetical protein
MPRNRPRPCAQDTDGAKEGLRHTHARAGRDVLACPLAHVLCNSRHEGQQPRAVCLAPARVRARVRREGTKPCCSTFVLLSAFLWRPLDTRNNLAKRLILPMKIAIGF